jgi:hypothetical protein
VLAPTSCSTGLGAPADVEKTRSAIKNDASPFRSAYVAAREQDVLNHPILAHVACLHRFRVNQGRASMAVADPPLPRLGFRTPTCDFFQLFCDARPSIRLDGNSQCLQPTCDPAGRGTNWPGPSNLIRQAFGIASFDAMRKVVAGQIGRGSAANPSITKNVEPARPDRHCQTAPSGMKTKLPARASKAR